MKSTFLTVTVLFFSFSLLAQATDTAPIRREFENSSILQKHFYGFSLYDLDSNRYLMGLNADKLFTPASNTKIFTLFAALTHLGDSIPGLHYIESGDSLIFWGTGDPTFLHNRLESGKVFAFLKNSNKQLYYAMPAAVEETFYRKGWAMEDFEEYYQPEICSFPIYGNVVTFRERNGQLKTSPAFFEDMLSYKASGSTDYTLGRDFSANLFYKNKRLTPNNYVNEKPFRYSDQLFVQLLSDTLKRKIQIVAREKPADHKTVFSHDRNFVLREMMLPSDNFLAEQLQMVIAQVKYGGFYTARLRKEMQSTYYDQFTDRIDLYDGSGLSSYNKLTPRSVVEVLLLIAAAVPDSTTLHRMFPTGGVDGTLKRAYALDRGEPFVWAKTGTVNAVHNQSGFIRTRTGRNFVFSFLNTNFLGEPTAVRREMVRIMTFIRQQY